MMDEMNKCRRSICSVGQLNLSSDLLIWVHLYAFKDIFFGHVR